MIKFYSKENCAQCSVFKQMLDIKKVEYEVIQDPDIYMPIAQANGIMGMPFGEVDGVILKPVDFKNYIMNLNNDTCETCGI